MLIVSLVGLKKSGKTTTAEALIREFKAMGMKVGAVKSMVHSRFTIDTPGKDTARHKEAGADFVISISEGELAYIEKKNERPSLDDIIKFVPDDAEILVCEGLETDDPRVIKVLVLESLDKLDETLKIRGVKSGVVALSGIIASKVKKHEKWPVFDCTKPDEVKKLAEMILKLAKD
jgi:molybdopterin-guanine dinucleotide biosynthesis protein MobB